MRVRTHQHHQKRRDAGDVGARTSTTFGMYQRYLLLPLGGRVAALMETIQKNKSNESASVGVSAESMAASAEGETTRSTQAAGSHMTREPKRGKSNQR
eukprot:943519-Pleurochrysis_carterae.AAC.2